MKKTEQLDRIIKKKRIDALFVINPINRFYLTGMKSSLGYIYVSRKVKTLYLDSRYIEVGRKTVGKSFKVKLFKSSKELIADFRSLLKKDKVKKLGIEGRFVTYNMLGDLLGSGKGYEIVDISSEIDALRAIKNMIEIENIKKAIEITGKVYDYVLNIVKPGITEKELSLEMDYMMRKFGGDKIAFDIIALFGKNSSLPHGVPSDTPLKHRDMVLIDFGVSVNGYCSDLTRTFFMGKPWARMKKVYDLVLKANKKAIKTVMNGVLAKNVDKAARNIISQAGFGKYFGHGLGHGIGLDVHEAPVVSPSSGFTLRSGMVFTIEPGIYLPDIGGVRIEDDIYIKGNRVINLSKEIPKELIVL